MQGLSLCVRLLHGGLTFISNKKLALTSARFCARARRRFSPQNRALGLSVFGNHIVVAKLVEAARAKLFSHRTARIERFENYPFMTDDHKSSFMFAKYYLFL